MHVYADAFLSYRTVTRRYPLPVARSGRCSRSTAGSEVPVLVFFYKKNTEGIFLMLISLFSVCVCVCVRVRVCLYLTHRHTHAHKCIHTHTHTHIHRGLDVALKTCAPPPSRTDSWVALAPTHTSTHSRARRRRRRGRRVRGKTCGGMPSSRPAFFCATRSALARPYIWSMTGIKLDSTYCGILTA